MAYGSAYSPVKAALVTRLGARSGLAGVKVNYQSPVKAEDIAGDSGTFELVYFDDADGDTEVRVFAGDSPLIFDEDYIQTCFIQVLMQEQGTQQEADERAGELLYQVLAELAHQAEWDYDALGLGTADFEYVTVTPAGWRTKTGFLPAGAGHGAGYELRLRVRARRLFTAN